MQSLLRWNLSLHLAFAGTLLTWATLPVLWVVNEWGVLSFAEGIWLLVVAAAWLLAVGGLLRARHPFEGLLALGVFAWSSLIPMLLLVVAFLLVAADSGADPAFD